MTYLIKPKHSIARRIGLYFLIMIAFASLISGLSLGIMWSNQSDAALINVSGSLRFQSYRFLDEMEHHPENVKQRLVEYRATLHSSELLALKHECLLPSEVITSYNALKERWRAMEILVYRNDRLAFAHQIEAYTDELNRFVLALQKFAELKLKIATAVIALAMLLIIALAYYGVWYTRKRIIVHLDQLVTASQQVQNEEFNHVQLAINEPNELGVLSSAFTQMVRELSRLYTSLEDEVEAKTRSLTAINHSMSVLYYCSQLLTAKPISKEVLFQVLETVQDSENLLGIDLDIYGANYWNVSLGELADKELWCSYEITIENEKLAMLRWKGSLACPDERIIQSVAEMIGRSLYVVQMHKQQQQLVLMEERSIIARELHDSLAQSLTFFKIQISLLKRNGETVQDWAKQKAILSDLEKALNEAYVQLRELLSTFRLTIQEANLTRALERVLDSLKSRTSAQIRLNCKLPSQIFSAQQQVHVLQIVREAVINAIKHSQATEIDVIAETNSEGEHCVIIRDNGKGLESEIEPEGHYGLTIMKERAAELEGEFSLKNRAEGGLDVIVLLPNMLGKR